MKIRDSHAIHNKDETEYTMRSSGLQIVADDGRTLFEINLKSDGSIRIGAGTHCAHRGDFLDDTLIVKPEAANVVVISRPVYQK